MKKIFLYLIVLISVTSWAQAPKQVKQFNLKQSLRFEENKGQVANTNGEVQKDILYTMKDNGMNVYFRKSGISYQWYYTEELPEGPYNISEATGLPVSDGDESHLNSSPSHLERGPGGEVKPTTLHTYRVDMQWLGANENVQVISEGQHEAYNNYYHAHCPDGVTNVKSYAKLIYKNMYPNIDIVYYVKDDHLKYDVLVHAGGNISNVKFKYDGAEPKLIDGKIRIETPLGFLEEREIIAWDSSNDKVKVHYEAKGKALGFKSENNFDELVTIDPDLVWGTYYGGTGDDQGQAVDTDGSENIYLTGYTSSTSSIAQTGHQLSFGGMNDGFLSKFSEQGQLQWATYYGGDQDDRGVSVSVDPSNYVYIGGTTFSSTAISSNGHQNSWAGSNDVFLVKFLLLEFVNGELIMVEAHQKMEGT
jgi:hypothetical protein